MSSYRPSPAPSRNVSPELRAWLTDELRRIAIAIAQGEVPVTDVEPEKPFKSMLAWALGSNWDPGAGEGLYVYNGSTWDKVN